MERSELNTTTAAIAAGAADIVLLNAPD